MRGGLATLPLCVGPRVGGRQVFRIRPLISIPRSRLCGIERKKRRHAKQRDGQNSDTHSKHDACSDFCFGRKDRRRIKPVRKARRALALAALTYGKTRR